MQDVKDLALIIDSKVPLIALETYDEPAALQLLTRVAMHRQLGYFCWSLTEGLNRLGFGDAAKRTTDPESPSDVLRLIKRQSPAALIALCDYHPFLINQPENVRLLKDIAMAYEQLGHTLILISHEIEMPPELKRYSAKFELALPGDTQLLSIIRDEASAWSKENPQTPLHTDTAVIKKLVRNLRGLTEADVRRLARGAIRDDGAITESDIPEINRAKFEMLDMGGVLSFEYDTAKFSAVGGLKKLKEWAATREQAITSHHRDRPKGVLLLGVQGSGKSLAAKSLAGLWALPLLRLDMGALYNKYIGETEKNLRRALSQAELMAPCVLWMDELEKGLAGGNNDEGTSQRILGTLLTWMSEHTTGVFVVATANDVNGLPPELLRKGRFDEIFFVDLPDAKTREEIFSIHLRQRNFDPARFELPALAALSEKFSGAEIEQAVVAAIYTCSARREPMNNSHIEHALTSSVPLAIMLAEKIEGLRQWAKSRTVSAD
ncbi:MAG: ATPase [Verrucomicrobiaceae bacterium]|nr:ATPase [Verrucomicrobiaceae bacterium]